MRISDWSSDVCSADLCAKHAGRTKPKSAGAIQGVLQERALLEPRANRVPPLALGFEHRRVGMSHQFIEIARQWSQCSDAAAAMAAGDAGIVGGDRKSTRLNSSHYCATSMQTSD